MFSGLKFWSGCSSRAHGTHTKPVWSSVSSEPHTHNNSSQVFLHFFGIFGKVSVPKEKLYTEVICPPMLPQWIKVLFSLLTSCLFPGFSTQSAVHFFLGLFFWFFLTLFASVLWGLSMQLPELFYWMSYDRRWQLKGPIFFALLHEIFFFLRFAKLSFHSGAAYKRT